MKKLLFVLFFIPTLGFADRLGSLKSNADVLLTTQAVSATLPLPSGSTNYVWVTTGPVQAGAFNISSGTVFGPLTITDNSNGNLGLSSSLLNLYGTFTVDRPDLGSGGNRAAMSFFPFPGPPTIYLRTFDTGTLTGGFEVDDYNGNASTLVNMPPNVGTLTGYSVSLSSVVSTTPTKRFDIKMANGKHGFYNALGNPIVEFDPVNNSSFTIPVYLSTLTITNQLRDSSLTPGTSGQFMMSRGSGLGPQYNPVPSSGGGTPGGSNSQIQFNNGGSFGGNAALTFSTTTLETTITQTNGAGNGFLNFDYTGGSIGGGYGRFEIQPGEIALRAGNFGGKIKLSPYNGGVFDSSLGLTVSAAGNVAVGTDSPPANTPFSVTGDTFFNGNVSIGTNNLSLPFGVKAANNMIGSFYDTTGTGATRVILDGSGNNIGFGLQSGGVAKWSNAIYPYVNSAHDYTFYNDQISAAAFFLSGTSNRMQVGFTGNPSANPAAQFVVTPTVSSTIGQIIQGAASQSVDLIQWRNSSGVAIASVTASGIFTGNGSGLTNLPSVSVFSGSLFVGLTSGTSFQAFVPTSAITLKNISFMVDVASAGGSGDTLVCGDASGHSLSVVSANAAAAGILTTTAGSANISAGTTVYMRLDSGAVTKPQGNISCDYVTQ